VKVIAKPRDEETILQPVKKEAKPEEIYQGVVEKAECCVVHLCGCSCDHKGC
jgi:hypothetical protein